MQPHDTTNEVPYGYCQCGCGEKTWVPKTSDKKYGWIKGQPVRYISGHNNHNANMPKKGPNPSGICMCGCGQPAPISRQTNSRAGWVIGQPLKYRAGHGKRKPLDVCFWAKAIPGAPDECWIWRGSFKFGGYGKLPFRGHYLSAHRVSYELHHGVIPIGLNCLHKCDTPACVNPSHLFVGTQADNVQDMMNKGRDNFHGRKNPKKE